MLAQALERIRAFPSWDQRIDALGLVLKSHLSEVLHSRANVDASLLKTSAAIAKEGLSAALRESKTIDTGTFQRAGFGEILDSFASLVFSAVGQHHNQVLSKTQVLVHSQAGCLWELAQELREMLQLGSQWILRVASGFRLSRCLAQLPPGEQQELAETRGKLASLLGRSYGDVLFSRSLRDCTSEIHQTIDRIRHFGTLAQLDKRTNTGVENEVCRAPGTGASLAFHLTVSPPAAAQKIYGVYVVTDSAALFLSSKAWSHWVNSYLNGTMAEKNSLLQVSPPSLMTSPTPLDAHSIHLTDLTRGNVPLEIVLDPSTKCSTSQSPVSLAEQSVVPKCRIHFWGGFEYARTDSYQVTEQPRTIRWRTSADVQGKLLFPHIAESLPRLKGVPIPLPLTHYDRWELSDIAQQSGSTLQTFVGRAVRQEFLDQDWADCDILHLATHGEAFSEIPECSHLVLGNPGTGPTCVLFSDILARDWSSLSLVFLNCCVTQVGKQTYGDDRLSLAWAFLAGGAKAVIAHRWKVRDNAAWLFAKRFYAAALLERMSLRMAFLEARRFLRQQPGCDDASVWATFVLIENPWI